MEQTRPIAGGAPTVDVSHVRQLARLLDAAVRIPGTDVRLGLDAVLGLIPGAGDIAGGILSAFIVLHAARLGAPRSVLTRMVMNVVIDTVVGSVPVLGDVFDVGWKSNMRNVALLERYVERPGATRSASRLAVAGAVAALLLVVAGAVALVVVVIRGLARLAT
jgi:Domain of unknown function (DUF4112)